MNNYSEYLIQLFREKKMAGRPFILIHTFKDLSKLREGQSYYSDIEVRYNIPWRLRIFKNDGFLGVNLHCEKEECIETKKWTFQTKFTMKLVTVGGKFFRRIVQHEFQKPEGYGMDKFISWENMLRDYVDNDSTIIEIHADIVSSTGFFEVKYLPNLQPDSNNSFVLKHTFKNLSRFEEDEKDFSDAVDHYNIPWIIEIIKTNEFLGIYLNCQKEYHEGRKWSIKCKYEFKLISASGNLHSAQQTTVFGNGSSGWGDNTFISWNDMENEYVNNDSIDVEISVKIIKFADEPCTMQTFALSHTIKNMSSIREGEDYDTDTQYRFNIPWRLRARKTLGFLEIVLFCNEEYCMAWNKIIEADCTFTLVCTNGSNIEQTLKLVFDKSGGQGISRFIRWDEMEKYYQLNGSVNIQAKVKLNKVEELPCEILPAAKSFTLSHTVANISNMRKGTTSFSNSEEWNYALWKVCLKNNNGFAELFLNCGNENSEQESRTVEAKYQLSLVGAGGKQISEFFEHNFETPDSNGDPKVIRWKDMLEQYAVDDSVRIEAHVSFTDDLPASSLVIKHVVEEISNINEAEYNYSKTKKHCEIPWLVCQCITNPVYPFSGEFLLKENNSAFCFTFTVISH
eukprot:NP_001040808.1 MATH (meprin-associated Traf homology) domain containing [Caenorhabditis elegans]